jgi:molybdenum cofactor cytidylyltransferase
MPRTFGLIPAAGNSRRMGLPKLALPLGGRSVLETVVAAVRAAGVDLVVVVLGPHGGDLATLAERAGATLLRLPAETAEMRDTIERGLDWIEHHQKPHAEDGWLLLPADHPCADADVIRGLLEARRQHPDRFIVVPTFAGRRGHPVWIGWQFVAALRALPHGLGVNALLRAHAAETLEVPVTSEAVLWDLDTPEDYERLRARLDSH